MRFLIVSIALAACACAGCGAGSTPPAGQEGSRPEGVPPHMFHQQQQKQGTAKQPAVPPPGR